MESTPFATKCKQDANIFFNYTTVWNFWQLFGTEEAVES
jgi:hypothetical protein